ncbi:MAG: YpdA family putative bacillithiol disulfide reductase [Flavobacteriia bacterium]|nr:YpdA family putative bacillithiol disulfide reductase [Flavobacteriia bacterium]
MSKEKVLDLLIIGGGPIGISCAIAAQEAGLSYLVLEKGCLTNSLFNYPLDMQFFSSSEKLELNNIPFNSIEPKPRRKEALEYYRRISAHYTLNIQLFEEVLELTKVSDDSPQTPFLIKSNKRDYLARNTVVATGFFDIPALLDVPGESLKKVTHYFKEAHYYTGQKVAVIGASNSAIDAALACYRKGAVVTLIIRGPEVGPRVKYWVRPDIINRIEEGSIKVYYNAAIKDISATELSFITDGLLTTIENDFVLALTGYRPNLKFLERIGIELEGTVRRPQYLDETMETNVPGVFLAGVICGGLETHKWFIENSRDHGAKIVQRILEKKS